MIYPFLLQHVFLNALQTHSQKEALVCNKNRYSYQDLARIVAAIVVRLNAFNIQRGDRIMIDCENSAAIIACFWAVLIKDAVVIIAARDWSQQLFKQVIDDAEPVLIITDNETRDATPITRCVLDFDKIMHADILLDKQLVQSYQNQELDLAALIYTSGSSGEPKGVMLSHRNMLAALNSVQSYLHYSCHDKILSALPLSFDYGLYQMLLAFNCGATLVQEKDALLPVRLLSLIEKEAITILPCVPSLINLLTNQAAHFQYDYTSLKKITNTGAALTLPLIKKLQHHFPAIEIYAMYGLTECKRCSYLPPQDICRKPGSVGFAIPNTEIWIVDEAGNPLPPGQMGQIVVRGATVMQGYWRKPEATAIKLKSGCRIDEKILYTGDYGLMDDEGYLYFKGRMDELIKIKGHKILPLEIERKISAALNRADLAVVAVEDACDTKLVLFYDGAPLADFINELMVNILSPAERPADIQHLSVLPKSGNGKIDKNALKNLYLNQQSVLAE